ncbi:MAG: PAS domain-containing protein, partial [Rhodospirillales bacterium]|nr:PAS domain-containing protein [Rhodospirillales bacterium]
MAEAAGRDSGKQADATAAPGGKTDDYELKAKRRVNRTVLAIATAMLAAVGLAVFGSFYYVEGERQREVQAWQVRLGIVADSRAAAINEWIDQNFAAIRELAENASLQVYMSELESAGQAPAAGAKKGKTEETDLGTKESGASAGYLRNLLVATAERTGFKAPAPVGEVAANVERAGVAGIGLVDKAGNSLASTPDMPPITAKIRAVAAKALEGQPSVIDLYLGASGLPTIGFALPVFGIQQDGAGAKGIGAVIGLRTVGDDLYKRLKQPGDTAKTTETYIVRSAGATIEYLTPLADGTPPLKRSMSAPITNLPWVLIRKISRDEALSATDTRLKTILTVFVLLIVGVTVAIIAVWRHGSSLRATQAAANMKVALERFENMSKFMRVVTNSQRNIIVAVDGETKYTFANEPGAKEAGIPAADMLGKTMASVLGPIKAQSYAAINRNVLKNFERESHTITFGDEDSEDADFQIVQADFVPLRGDRDFPPAVLMVVNDITELTHEKRRSEKMLKGLINTLVSVVDRRDPFSANHSARVAEVARAIAGEMGLAPADCKTVEIAGNLMNLGKIFIPTEVLTKATDLTPEERA